MANETTTTSLADSRVAAVVSARYLRALAARDALPMHAALFYAGDVRGSGSNVITVPEYELWGFDAMTSRSEAAATPSVEIGDNSYDVTVGAFAKAHAPTDEVRGTDPHNALTAPSFLQDALDSSNNLMVQLVANVVDDFTTVVGSSGVDATLADHLAAIAALEAANVKGPYLAVYHSTQWNNIMEDIALNSGGTVQWDKANQDMTKLRGPGFKGNLHGVDVFVTNKVNSANGGADRAGGMFGRGAVLWGDMSLSVDVPAQQALIGGKVLFELDREGANGVTKFITHRHLGVAKGVDACGVSIVTDL